MGVCFGHLKICARERVEMDLLRWTLCDYIAWMEVSSEWVRVDGPNNETRHLSAMYGVRGFQ